MKKFVMVALVGSVAGILLTRQVVGPLIAEEAEKSTAVYEQLDLFGDIFERVRAQYVEETDSEKLIQAAINGMLTSLDPHSSYMPPDDFADMQVQTRGEFGGLGIEVTQEEGYIKVVSPMDGTPADKAGIKAGDFITQVNGESVMGLSLDEAVDKMRGPVGSEILLTIVREGTEAPFDVSLIRDMIKVTAVKGRTVGNTVVLRVSTFNEQTTQGLQAEFKKGVEKLGGLDNVEGFVLDLRNNPGGLLTEAISVSDAFLEKGEIVSTRGRNPQDGERFNATPGDITKGKPIVVLINGGSASASEIVTGALQDHHRAIVLGTKSFGKGSVQTVVPLRGQGAMRLTTARYYTPSGRSIQALGVMPDIVVNQPKVVDLKAKPTVEENAQGGRSEADLRGILSNDTMTENEKLLLEQERTKLEEAAKLRDEDYQLAYAVDIIHGLSTVVVDQQPWKKSLWMTWASTGKESVVMTATELPYRPCVGIVLINAWGEIFAGKRLDSKAEAWQMPQGGIDEGEKPRQAALRELWEETGVSVDLVEFIATTKDWVTYDLPLEFLGKVWGGKYRGQRQMWFLFRFLGSDDKVRIDSEHPEFRCWRWMVADDLIASIVPFKRAVYKQVLEEFCPHLA